MHFELQSKYRLRCACACMEFRKFPLNIHISFVSGDFYCYGTCNSFIYISICATNKVNRKLSHRYPSIKVCACVCVCPVSHSLGVFFSSSEGCDVMWNCARLNQTFLKYTGLGEWITCQFLIHIHGFVWRVSLSIYPLALSVPLSLSVSLSFSLSVQVMIKICSADDEHMLIIQSVLFAIEAMSNVLYVWHLFQAPLQRTPHHIPYDKPSICSSRCYLLFNFVLLLWLIKFLLYKY